MADKVREARRRGAPVVESFSKFEIFERDGWRCGICHEQVDRRLTWPHPRSVSLDHVLPIAAGGEHSRRNVQCSHLECNLRKNARAADDQLRLVG